MNHTESTCPLCEGRSLKIRSNVESNFFLCNICNHNFSTPTNSLGDDFYENTYFANNQDGVGYQSYESDGCVLQKDFYRRIRLLTSYANKSADTLELLEIGSATGLFLEAARKCGIKTIQGIELSKYGVHESRRKGFTVSQVNIDKMAGEDLARHKNSHDSIVAFDVLEHVNDPKAMIEKMYSFLQPGGVIFLSTPNYDSVSRKLMGTRWIHYKKEHLHYFSVKNLRKILEEAGFHEIIIKTNYSMVHIPFIFDKLGLSLFF